MPYVGRSRIARQRFRVVWRFHRMREQAATVGHQTSQSRSFSRPDKAARHLANWHSRPLIGVVSVLLAVARRVTRVPGAFCSVWAANH